MVENTTVGEIQQQLKTEYKKNTVGKRYKAEVMDSAKSVSINIQNKLQKTAFKLTNLASDGQKDKYVKLRKTLDKDLNNATKDLGVRDSIRRHEAIINDLARKIDNTENQCIMIINQVEANISERLLRTGDGKIDKNEKQYLAQKKGSVVLSEKMVQDIEKTNIYQFIKPGKTKDILTALNSNWDNVIKQMQDKNKNNFQQQSLINKIKNIVTASLGNSQLKLNQKNIVIINALLSLNNTSKTNISDFTKIGLESANAIFEFQKHYEGISGWSKADYIVGPKTIQQLCNNIGISNIGNTSIDKKYDASQAGEIDKERGYTHRQFVIEGLSTYRAYLQGLKQNMSMKMFSNADEKLDEQIKALDTAIFHITNKNMDTKAINEFIDKLIIDPRAYRSWMQQGSNLIFKSGGVAGTGAMMNKLQKNTSSKATLFLKNLLKNPGNFQTARQSFLSIMRTMDGSSGNLDRNSGSYADMARSEAINSKEAHNDTNIAPAIQKIKSFMGDEANINKIKDLIEQGKDEVAIKEYIKNTGFTRDDPALQQKINYLFDTDEMEQIVDGVKELIKNEGTNKTQLKKQLNDEKIKLEGLNTSLKLNEDGKQRLNAIQSAYANSTNLDAFVNEAYQASIKSTISSIMEDYLVFNMMEKNDSSLGSQKNIVGLYADIKGVGGKISDKVANIMANTTIDIGVEVAIAIASFSTVGAAGALIYGARVSATGAARATFRSLVTRAMRFIPRLASKEGAKATAKAAAKKAVEYGVKGAAFTGTSEALRNLRTANDRSDYANNFKKGCKENFLSNTAMLGILKYVHGSFEGLHIAGGKSINLLDKATRFSKNQVVNTLKFITEETGISLVDYGTKALITDRPYSSEDLVNTIAESLAFELLADGLGAPLSIVNSSGKKNGQSILPVTYNNKPANIIIQGSESSLVQNGKVIKKVNLENVSKKNAEGGNNQNDTYYKEIKQLKKDIDLLKNPSDMNTNPEIQKLRNQIKKIANYSNINELSNLINLYFDPNTKQETKTKLLEKLNLTHEKMLALKGLVNKIDTTIGQKIARIKVLEEKINGNNTHDVSEKKQGKMESSSKKNAENNDRRPEITFKNNNVEGFNNVQLSEISKNFLTNFGSPKHSIEFGGNKLYVTNILEYDGYKYLIGYTDSGDLRMFYRSGSESEWRSCPGRRSSGGFSKLEIAGYSYETTTKLETSINTFFDTLSAENIRMDPILYSKNFTDNFQPINSEEMGKSITIEAMFPKLKLQGAVDFFKGKTSEKIKSDYDNLTLPKDFDLSQMKSIPKKGYSFKHDHLGDVKVDVAQMKRKGKSVDVHFARAINNSPDKVFITNIVYSDAKVNSFGVYDKQINAGPLTAKPIEYSSQLPSDHPGKRYGDSYADIRDLYQGMSLIKEYKKKSSY